MRLTLSAYSSGSRARRRPPKADVRVEARPRIRAEQRERIFVETTLHLAPIRA